MLWKILFWLLRTAQQSLNSTSRQVSVLRLVTHPHPFPTSHHVLRRRIEIEGGSEIPIVDGSALGWALNIQFSGLRHAPTPAGYFAEGRAHSGV